MKNVGILIIAVGLSMDSMAVSMTNGMIYHLQRSKSVIVSLIFSLFQALMPLFGYIMGIFLFQFPKFYSNLAVLVILGVIGVKMIVNGFHPDVVVIPKTACLKYRLVFTQALSTSLDALALGVGLRIADLNIITAMIVIAITTFICCLVAIKIGKKFGDYLGSKAQILGGIILLCIGIKAFL